MNNDVDIDGARELLARGDEGEGWQVVASVPGKTGTLYIRDGRAVARAGPVIGFSVLAFAVRRRSTTGRTWSIDDEARADRAVWPGPERPSPADVVNWLASLDEHAIIAAASARLCQPVSAAVPVLSARSFVGYDYQIEYAGPTAPHAWREKRDALAAELKSAGPGQQGGTMETPEQSAAAPASSVVKKKIPQPAAGSQPVKKKPKKEAPAKRPARVSKDPKLDEYSKKKLAAQKQVPVGKTVTYSGPTRWANGKQGKVSAHESRGGVFVAIGDKKLLCSPFALIEKKKGDKKD